MNKLESIKKNMETCTDWYVDNCLFLDDMKWLIQRLERYESLINQARDKSQVLASHCAYCKGIGYNLDAQDTFEKSQAIYELLRDELEDEIT